MQSGRDAGIQKSTLTASINGGLKKQSKMIWQNTSYYHQQYLIQHSYHPHQALRKELNQALNHSTQLQIRYEEVLEKMVTSFSNLNEKEMKSLGYNGNLNKERTKLELLRRFEHEAKELDLLEQLEQGRREKLELLKQFEHEEKRKRGLIS